MEALRRQADRGWHVAGLALLLVPWLLFGGGAGCLPRAPKPSATPSQACPSSIVFSSADPSVTLYPFEHAGEIVNARGVDWLGDPDPGFGVQVVGPQAGCFEGGSITGPWNPSSTWETYHLTAGLSVNSPSPGVRVKSLHVSNYGDGVSVEPSAPCPNGSQTPWAYVHASHLEDIHDDAIEADGLCAMEIADNLLERVYVAFAFKHRRSDPNRVGFNNTVTIIGNLIRAHAFENNYEGSTVHNGYWKWSHEGRGPKIILRDNVFLAFDPPPSSGNLFPYVNKVVACEDNELLFAGSEAEWQQALAGGCDTQGDDGLCDGERLLALSHCYTVITKSDSESEADFLATHWDPLVEAWKAEHSADDE